MMCAFNSRPQCAHATRANGFLLGMGDVSCDKFTLRCGLLFLSRVLAINLLKTKRMCVM